MEFNQEQKQIIDSINGAYLVAAPVGTGKTTVLTERVVRALEQGIKPEEILCLTFTNRAAEEMSKRIRARLNDKSLYEKIIIKTFHGFCSYLIRAEAKNLGIGSDFSIFDEDEQLETMEKVLEDYPDLIQLNEQDSKKRIKQLMHEIYLARVFRLGDEIGWKTGKGGMDKELSDIQEKYNQAIRNQNALDFNELVLATLEALYKNEEILEKWSTRFKLIQLDEFQDTHVSEYLAIKQLARKHKNILLMGDLDQTIYGWRGSEPFYIIGQYKKHFSPVKEFSLSMNYRFNANLLDSVRYFLKSFNNPQTMQIDTMNKVQESGKVIDIFSAYNFSEEISWVVDNIKEIKKEEKNARIAVLSRSNYQVSSAAECFGQKNIPFTTVDKYEFFRRREIKDALSRLKLIFNRFDIESAYRAAQRPPQNIGLASLESIRKDGEAIGLKISDFLSLKNYNYAEPYENLIKLIKKGRIIVLDTETTGINPLKDEIIQIYAREVVDGELANEFHHFLRNTLPLGSTVDIHGITDEFLKEKGEDPKSVLTGLKDFIGKDIVSGHNVVFDLSMIAENGKRHGIVFDFQEYYDTLDMSRRFVKAENYRLNTLASILGLSTATHSADDDVMATIGLLKILAGILEKNSADRKALFSRYSKKFLPLSMKINNWFKIISEKRPGPALEHIWSDSGLKEYYEKGDEAERRIKSISSLVDFFNSHENSELVPAEAMRELINYSSLVKNIEFLGLEQGSVPIATVHQVKGLEFDYVFIIGMNDYKFPIKRSLDQEEEKRLFYVALTRARKKIFLTFSTQDDYGRPMAKSSFLDYLDPNTVNYIR